MNYSLFYSELLFIKSIILHVRQLLLVANSILQVDFVRLS